jgi:glycosyltransferase involved in cell wall biosynthesis
MAGESNPIFYSRQGVIPDSLSLADESAPLHEKPLVSLVVPAYNEAAVVEKNLAVLCQYMQTLEQKYDWELLVVNDGSKDNTSMLAKAFAATRANVFVLDHAVNFGLGQALKFAFNECHGDYIVTVDMDLSYSPDHIERLLDTLISTRAKIVLASPYLKGGSVENVPEFRRILSVGANKFLSIASHGRIKTLTGMVRAYDARFLRTLDFYSMGMEVNSEILYKAMVLRARIEEIPAVLKWHLPDPDADAKPARKSSMRIAKYVATLLVSGFLYRPIMFFAIPGLTALAISGWCAIWMVVDLVQFHGLNAAWNASPATFFTGFFSLLAAAAMLSCGLVSLQNKCYFEQMFHLGTTTYRTSRGATREIVREGKK